MMSLINNYAKEHQLDKIKLNLGCGGRPLKGWINIDFLITRIMTVPEVVQSTT